MVMDMGCNSTECIRRICSPGEFFYLRERWNGLLADSSTDSFFLRWEWLWEWWNAYKDDFCDLCILLVYRGGDLIGIAPFYVIKPKRKNIYTVRTLMFLGTAKGSVISEHMDMIYRAGDEETVIRSVMEFIAREDICDDILIQKIESNSKTIVLLEQMARNMGFSHSVFDRSKCPYICLPARYEDFLNGLSGSMRCRIRKNQKKLLGYSDVVFRRTRDISELNADFEELVRTHQLRWESQGMPGSFNGGRFLIFQKKAVKDMLMNGHLELNFLSVSGKNIAALYNINYKNKIYFYQAGLDASFDEKLAPGILLHNHCVNEAIKNGLEEYDFLLAGSMDSYKTQWTGDYRYLLDIYMARPMIIKYMMFIRNRVSEYRKPNEV
jgi:hypothetical protein